MKDRKEIREIEHTELDSIYEKELTELMDGERDVEAFALVVKRKGMDTTSVSASAEDGCALAAAVLLSVIKSSGMPPMVAIGLMAESLKSLIEKYDGMEDPTAMDVSVN